MLLRPATTLLLVYSHGHWGPRHRVLSRGYRRRLLSKGHCYASVVSRDILLVRPTANTCVSRYEYMLLLQPHMVHKDTRQTDLVHVQYQRDYLCGERK